MPPSMPVVEDDVRFRWTVAVSLRAGSSEVVAAGPAEEGLATGRERDVDAGRSQGPA